MSTDRKTDVAIIGAGSAGLYAMPRVRKSTKGNFVLINSGPYGTTCARVGCMPSKVLIQVAEDFHRRELFDRMGIRGSASLTVDIPAALQHVRKLRDYFVDATVANSTDRMSEENLITGHASFIEPNVLSVNGQTIRANKVIIATGSTPVIPKEWAPFQDLILTTDTLFEQRDLPSSMAVIGLGVIGLEMGQALSRLGIDITGLDMLETIGGLQDPAVNKSAVHIMKSEFPLWLGQPAEVSKENGKLQVRSGNQSVLVDKVLASLGRRPNVDGLGLENLGVKLDKRGIPEYDPATLQIGDFPIFIAGDVNSERPVLHEAADQGRIAGFNAAHDAIQGFRRKIFFAITFSDPNIVAIGARWNELKDDPNVVMGESNFASQGRSRIIGKNKGILHLYAAKDSGRLLGAEMIIPKGENIGHTLAWSIQQGLTVFDLLKMPFYHPVVEEGIPTALHHLRRQIDVDSGQPILELATL